MQVPDVSNVLPSTWAMPCVPFAGIQSGFYAVPAIGSQVWVEFEQGNPDYPIWVGCFWGSAGDVPALALAGVPGPAAGRDSDHRPEHADDQRYARPDRRHPAQVHRPVR